MEGKGSALLDLFIRAGCTEAISDGMNGDDLDWVWEVYDKEEETRDFLTWICDPKTISQEANILTNEEVERWEKLKKESPNSILSGQRLKDAIEIIRQDEILAEEEKIAQKTDEALSDMLSGKRELLDAQECQLQELDRIQKNTNARKSKLSLKVSRAEEKSEKQDNDIVRKQQSVLHLNEEYNSSLANLSQVLKRMETKINGKADNEQSCRDIIPTTLLGTLDKSMILKEDKELSGKIEEYVDSNLQQTYPPARGSQSSPWIERTEVQHNSLVAEISRLKICQDAEKKVIIGSAQVCAAKAAKQKLEKEREKLIQGKISIEKTILQRTISELESQVNKLEEELANIIKDKLPAHLEESTSNYCQEIFKADIEAKIKRQDLVLSKMDNAIDVLLEQSAYQEVIGLLIEDEGNGLLELKEKLFKIVEWQANESDLEEKEKCQSESIKGLKERRNKKILQPEDAFLLALHQILSNTRLEPNLITEDDVVHLVTQFVAEMNRLETMVRKTESEWQRQKLQIEGLIDILQKELQIDSNNRCVLTPVEVANKIKLAENKVREFETAVRKKIQQLEDLKREIKSRPFLATQKAFNGTNIIETFGSTSK